jgi:ribosome-associated protein
MDVTDALSIPEDELLFTFARSGGPGGQNVNKVSSKAVLRWNLAENTSLPAEVMARLRAQQANRITTEGELLVQSQRTRDQARNVEDCRERLRAMVLRALAPPTPRKKTRPTRGSRQRRLADKRQQSARKQQRRKPASEE